MATHEKGQSLPKFGEWDVNNPASAEGFTVIFNKARDDKNTLKTNNSASSHATLQHPQSPPNKKKWLCFH